VASVITAIRQGRKWSFRPHPAATLATALLLPLLLALGAWQLQRAEQKFELRAEAATRAALPPLRITAASPPTGSPVDLRGRRIALSGRWDARHQVLLDNQMVAGRAGYGIYTPLRLAGDHAVLVNRGWLPADARREVAPDVRLLEKDVVVAGVAAPPPSPGPLARQGIDSTLGPGLLRVELLDLDDLSRRLGLTLTPWTLRLDASAKDGYWRDWPPPGGLAPERHHAYALQWFLLALLLVALYLGLNLHRR
jgi:surfeit locus 1 family protein